MKKFPLFLFLFAALPAFCGEAYFAEVFSKSAAERHVVLVDKQAMKLYMLLVKGDGHTIINTLDVIVGSNMNPKRVEGDLATPIGSYYVVSAHTSKELVRTYGSSALIYGMGSYPTNYPNPIDKALGRTGHGIWLHGLNPEGHKPATEGCVGMENVVMSTIDDNLSVGMAVVIADNATPLEEGEYLKLRDKVLTTTELFFNSWRQGNYTVYEGLIHPKYRSYAAGNAKSFLLGKKDLMKRYPERVIETDNVTIYTQDNLTLVYDADQFYCAPNLMNLARKRYYFAEEGGSLKLISEELIPKTGVSDFVERKSREFVEGWAADWRSADIAKYKERYSPKVATDKWVKFKAEVFEKAGDISVEIEELSVRVRAGYVEARFLQKYSSSATEDEGYKTLILTGCPGAFKIDGETFAKKR